VDKYDAGIFGSMEMTIKGLYWLCIMLTVSPGSEYNTLYLTIVDEYPFRDNKIFQDDR
jgi:hypothetical protein